MLSTYSRERAKTANETMAYDNDNYMNTLTAIFNSMISVMNFPSTWLVIDHKSKNKQIKTFNILFSRIWMLFT